MFMEENRRRDEENRRRDEERRKVSVAPSVDSTSDQSSNNSGS